MTNKNQLRIVRKTQLQQLHDRMPNRFKKPTMTKLPADFLTQPAVEGTRAHEYLSGKLVPQGLPYDPELKLILDDEQPDGSLLYCFKDGSSVAWLPPKVN